MKKSLSILLLLTTMLLYSQNSDETSQINEDKEFESAMNSMTAEAMDHFIVLHSESKLKQKAVQIRDSLALPEEGASYYKFSEYVSKYPNSRYSPSIIKKLPDMLDRDVRFQDSFQSTIEILKHFVTLYPTAPNIKMVKRDLELYYARSLSYKFNIEEYKEFRRLFPESRIYYNKTTKKMAERYDPKESPAATD
jgi:outer membrane protein assembly factor BamD (BamD/ComL family)